MKLIKTYIRVNLNEKTIQLMEVWRDKETFEDYHKTKRGYKLKEEENIDIYIKDWKSDLFLYDNYSKYVNYIQ